MNKNDGLWTVIAIALLIGCCGSLGGLLYDMSNKVTEMREARQDKSVYVDMKQFKAIHEAVEKLEYEVGFLAVKYNALAGWMMKQHGYTEKAKEAKDGK